MRFSFLLVLLFVFSCSEKKVKPSYISLHYKNDSIFVIAKNSQIVPTTLKISNERTKKTSIINFQKPDSIVVLRFQNEEIDSL